ncbi:MAG: site-specific integrase [Phormidesmis sp.]
MDISEKIAAINQKLRAQLLGVVIGQSANMLHLRGVFPPKPGSNKTRPHQQRLFLHAPANPAGLKFAEREARLVGAQLGAREFDWAKYIAPPPEETGSCGEWVNKLEYWFLNVKGSTPTTWKGDYIKGLRHLDMSAQLTPTALEAAILATKANTKSRVRACMAAGVLANFAGVEFDSAPLRGSYSASKTTPRNLPTDAAIAQYRDSIPNPEWRWVYGVMAAYGLRNHEAFKLDLADFPIVHVAQATKTGEREVWPCYPEWVEMWGLQTQQLPPIDLTRSNSAIGESVTRYLSPKLPFAPYDLRHCWAVRTLEYGWPDALSAQQMGHSLEVHNRTYQRWISKRHHQQVYDLLLKREDRPRPPGG